MKFILAAATALLVSTSALAHPVTLLVDFRDDATPKQIQETERELGLHLTPNSVLFSATKLMKVEVDSDFVDDYISKIDGDSDLQSVEVSHTYQAFSAPKGGADFDVPNDPAYDKQRWNFDMINLEQAWRLSTGKGVVVAIVDTGISGEGSKYPQVPDLAQTCMKKGYNFVDDNSDPYDRNSHGTHVGSSVAESTNNGLGGVGVAFNACLMPLKVLSDSGSGSTEDIAEAIRFAADNGAHIVNMSLGGGGYSKVMDDAIKYAVSKNVLVFCAAGNSGRGKIEFPAAMDGCLAISSVGPKGDLAPYSSYGEGGEGIFLASPGGDTAGFGPEGGIWQSTVDRNDPYKWGMFPYQGTSMATPIAAGVAALVVSAELEKNGSFDRQHVIDIMASTAADKGDEFKFGHGIVDAGAAVEAVGGGSSHHWKQILGAFVLACVIAFIAHRKMSSRRRW